MSLDAGSVVGRVILDVSAFDKAYAAVTGKMRTLGGNAEKSAAGVETLDASFAGAAAAADRAAIGMDRATKTTVTAGAASERAATQERMRAVALERVSAIQAQYARSSAAVRNAALRDAAAQERLTAASAQAGSAAQRQAAQTSRLASAQASAAGSAARLARSQESNSARMIAAGKKTSHALTLPVVAFAAVGVAQAAEFEKATNVYVTAAGESVKNLDKIRAGIRRIGEGTGTSMKNLTDAEYLVEKAGIRGASGLKVLDAAAKGAREENANLSDVVQAMTSVMASYHLSANQSVQVMNALKTGAGQAKVTMEEYASSLSTVIPIASANKVSLQQVLGAMSTLTQHGTTAKEATQELASTIRSLAAPNRVAQNQMQQLGLSVNDVSKNIGKRGLTGTISLLNNAIFSHMGSAGLVLQKAFNQSASAGRDAQVMMDHLAPSTQKLAQQYQTGKISLDDWRKSVKAMPTDQAALAKQFQVATDKAKGFNQLLRSGDPAAQTYSSALRKMTGGAIGLNTVLQLSGENMAGFQRRTTEVGASLHNTSKEVEGWHSTAELASVKADKLKESLRYLAIDGGDALLPVLTGIVGVAGKVVHWFDGLGSGEKKLIGYTVLLAAALGPILRLGGNLVRGFTLAAAGVTRLSAAFRGSAVAAGTASTETSAAMARETAAVRVATTEQSLMLANLSRQRAAMGATALAGAGGAAGAASRTRGVVPVAGRAAGAGRFAGAGGPAAIAAVGAYLGYNAGKEATHGSTAGGVLGAAGGFSTWAGTKVGGMLAPDPRGFDKLAGHIKLATFAAQQFAKAISVSGSVTSATTRATVDQSVGLSGLAAKAKKAGLTQKDLTNAVMGTNTEYKRTVAAWKAQGKPSADTLSRLGALRKGYQQAQQSAHGLAARQLDVGASASVLNHRTNDLTAAVHRNGATLDLQTSFGKKNASALTAAAAAAMGHARAVYAQTGSLDKANGALRTDIGSLERAAAAAGLNKAQVDRMVRSILGIPAGRTSNIKVNTSGLSQVQNLATIIRSLHDKTVTVYSRAVTTSTGSRVNADKGPVNVTAGARGMITRYAHGGLEDHSPMIAKAKANTVRVWAEPETKGEAYIPLANDSRRPRARAIASETVRLLGGVAHFASGGVSGNYAAIAALLKSMGATKAGIAGFLGNTKIESGGRTTAHNPGENAWGFQQWEGGRLDTLKSIARKMGVGITSQAAQLAMIKHELTGGYKSSLNMLRHARSASAAASFIDRNYEVSSGSARGARMSAANAFYRSGVSNGKGGGSNVSSAAAAASLENRAIQARTTAARTALTSAKKLSTDLAKPGTSQVTASYVLGHLKAAESGLAKAGASSNFVKHLQRENTGIMRAVTVRNAAAKALATAASKLKAAQAKLTADRANFTTVNMGGFDVTAAGTVGDTGQVTTAGLLAQSHQAVARLREWGADLKKLVASKVFPAAYVRQLAGKGPDALPQVRALIAMSAGDLASISKDYSTMNTLAGQAAQTAAVRLDQPAITAAQKTYNAAHTKEIKAQTQLLRDVHHAQAETVAELRHLHMHIDWKTGTLSNAVKTDAKKSSHR